MKKLCVERMIECIAKENYENFCRVVEKTKALRSKKEIIIFGAGIIGMQFAYALQNLGIYNFNFCDNNSAKWGGKLCGAEIVPPTDILNKKEKYFVFLAIENYYDCMKQLEELGYEQGRDWYNLTNVVEKKLIEDVRKDETASALVLGDCMVDNISIEEKRAFSLRDWLYREGSIKVLAMNGLYMRSLYQLFQISLKKMKTLHTMVLLLNLDIFSSKYHLLSNNQHEKFWQELYKGEEKNEEINDFLNDISKRSRNKSIFQYASPNRDENLSDRQIEQGRRNHLKLNYLYDLQEDNESVQYLDRMCEAGIRNQIKMIFVFMPVNWEMGEKYFERTFYERYDRLKDMIHNHIISRNGKVLDLSYLLSSDEFICLRSTNEGIREKGRERVAQMIRRELEK